MKKKIIVISVICLVVIALGIIIPVTIANKNKDKNPTIESRVIVVTEMVKSNSNAQVLISNNGSDTTCATGIRLKSGDTVITDDSSIVYFTCDNDKVFRINENSRIYIDEASSKKLKVKLLDGEIYFNVKTKLQDDESLDVVAGSTTMSVRGTIGNISYDTESGDLLVLVPEGKLACSSDSGTVEYATPGIGVKSSNDAIETLEVSVNEYPDNLLYEIIRDQETLDRVIEAFNEVVEDASEIIEFFEEKAEELEEYNFKTPTPTHEHKYSDYLFDEMYHYKECSCGEIAYKEEHSFIYNDNTEEDEYIIGVCSVCNYEIEVLNPNYHPHEVNIYTITYQYEGVNLNSYTVTFNENEFPTLENVVLEGYVFVGFFENGNLIKEINENRNYSILCKYVQDVTTNVSINYGKTYNNFYLDTLYTCDMSFFPEVMICKKGDDFSNCTFDELSKMFSSNNFFDDVYVLNDDNEYESIYDEFYKAYYFLTYFMNNCYIKEGDNYRNASSYEEYCNNFPYIYYQSNGYYSPFISTFTLIEGGYLPIALTWSNYINERETPSFIYFTDFDNFVVSYMITDIITGEVEVINPVINVCKIKIDDNNVVDYYYSFDQFLPEMVFINMQVGEALSDYMSKDDLLFGYYALDEFCELGTIEFVNESDYNKVIDNLGLNLIPIIIKLNDENGTSINSYIRINAYNNDDSGEGIYHY